MVKEKKVVVKKFRFMGILIVLLILYIFGFFIYRLLLSPVKNIYISNNNYLTDQEVIDNSGLKNYPRFFLTSKSSIKKKLLKNNIIKSVTIKKNFFGKIYIKVNENIPVFFNYNTNKTVLTDGREVNKNGYIVPVLRDNVEKDTYKRLVNKIPLIKYNILIMISEIKYLPNDIDKERFMFIMNDGNYVYITLTKIEAINEYINILETINGKKGTLYLDSGNYFEIFK